MKLFLKETDKLFKSVSIRVEPLATFASPPNVMYSANTLSATYKIYFSVKKLKFRSLMSETVILEFLILSATA